jgi:5-hydroxyisourate hydrolase-like protein (transthyretin family)/protocatechuate 3,4-dioxygenase beta subunit
MRHRLKAGYFGFFFALCLGLLFPRFLFSAEPRSPHGSTRVHHTVLNVHSDSERLAFPRSITPPVPFHVKARLALSEEIDFHALYNEQLTAKATLSGPGLSTPIELVTVPPAPFPLPTLALSGTYHLTDFRLYLGETLIAHGLDEVAIEVFEKLLVTEVTTRPLTLDEIISRGIVIDKSSFATLEFTAALAYSSDSVRLNVAPIRGPLLIDFKNTSSQIQGGSGTSSETTVFALPSPPDPKIPNLFIAPLDFRTVIDKDETPPPPPPLSGFVVIPGQIAFLHQFFEAQLVVLQNAPQGTPLVVRDLKAKILLPTGKDQAGGTDDLPGDDPLRIARQKEKETTRALPILKLGTPQNALAAQERGQALFLIEGLAEGTHDILFEITGILDGLPGGPVPVAATAAGSVLVRNPIFTMTLSHPSAVRSGQEYALYAVVTNTGVAPANQVSVRLNKNSVSGATLLSSETQTIDTIDPGSSASVRFNLRSRITGAVTATTFPTSDGTTAANGLTGRFALRTGVGDLGIPLSPDTLILPSYVSVLPPPVVDSAMALLGLAYSVATAPSGALPKGMSRIPKKSVEEKAQALAQAGLHLILGMPLEEVLTELLAAMTAGPDPYLRLLSTSAGKLLVEQIRALTKSSPSSNRSPRILAATQPEPDVIGYKTGTAEGCAMKRLHQAGVYLFVLASEPLDRKRAETVSHYSVDGTAPIAAMLDPTGRFVILQLARPVGPFIERALTTHSGLLSQSGHPIEAGTVSIQSHLSKEGAGGVSGRFLRAGGTLTEGSITLTLSNLCEDDPLSGKSLPPAFLIGKINTTAFYQFDYLLSDGSVMIRGEEISSGEYESVRPVFRVAGQMASLDLILRARGGMEITLLDEQGNPAPSTEVFVTSATSFVTGQQVSLASALKNTDDQGRARFSDLPVGPYQLQARRGQGVAAGSTAITRPGDLVSVTLQLASQSEPWGGSVAARVLAPDGKTPVAGVWLRLSSSTGHRGGQTDAAGALSLSHLLAGEALLEMYDPVSLETGSVPISILPNQTVSVTLIQKGLGSVLGRVIDSLGAPVAGVLVVARSDKNTQWGFTNTAGKFEFTALPVGFVSFSATEPVRGRSASGSTKIGYVGNVSQAELILSSRASLMGTVTDLHGRPVANAELRIPVGDRGCPEPPAEEVAFLTGGATTAILSSVRTGSQKELSDALDQFKKSLQALQASRAECMDAASNAAALLSFLHTKTDQNGNYRFSDLDLTQNVFRSGTLIAVSKKETGNANFSLPRDGEVKRVDLQFVDRTSSISGRVLDRGSNDLPVGARVVLYGVEPNAAGLLTQNRVIGWTDTDPETGSFSFAGLYPGPFHLTANNPFHPDGTRVAGVLAAGEARKVNLFFGKKLGSITGLVLGPDRKSPVAGVRVKTLLHSVPIEVTTDANGVYRIGKVLPSGYYSVEVDDLATGARSSPVTVNLEAGQEAELPLQVLGKGAINVSVYTPGGQPVAESVVKVTRRGDPVSRAEGKVDSEGVALFDALLEGEYAVEVYDRTGRGARGQVTIPADRQTGWVSVVLSEVGLVRGHFLAIDKKTPVSPARLLLLVDGKEVGMTTTAADGSFRFEHVPIGAVTVLGFNPATGRRAEGSGPLSRSGQDLPLLLLEEGLGSVSGRLLSADKVTPIAGAKLLLSSLSPLGILYGISRPDGSFLFDGIPVGPISLSGEDRRTDQVLSGSGVIGKEGERLEWVLVAAGSGNIDGTVIFADGKPVPFANIVSNGIRTQTDQNGLFSLSRQPLASHIIYVHEQNSPRSGVGYATLTQHGERLLVTIRLSGIGTIVAHIVDAGAPVEGAKVTLQSYEVTLFSNASGEARFDRLSQGSYTLTAVSPDQRRSATLSTQIVLDREVVDARIELGPTGSILVRVNRGDGTPASGAIATLSGKVSLTGQVGKDGNLLFDRLPVGPYTLTLDEAGTGVGTVQGLAEVPFTVRDHEQTDLGTIVLDNEPIRVVSITPADGESNVELNQLIRFRLSEPPGGTLSISTFQASEITLAGTYPIEGLLSSGSGGREWTFTPKLPLKSSTQYQVKIVGLTDQVGHKMVGSVVVRFESADRIPPKIVSIDPADDTIEVVQEAVIRILFSEPIAEAKESFVQLTRFGVDERLPLQVTLSDQNRLLIAQPTFPLQINAHYAVVVEGVTDLAGNSMRQAVRAQFATRDTVSPVIHSFTRDAATPYILGQPVRVMVRSLDADLVKIEIALDQSFIGFAEGDGPVKQLTFTLPFLLSDRPTLTAVAIDRAGNRSVASRIVIAFQDGPPQVVIEAPDQVAPGESVRVTVRSQDPLGLRSVSYVTTGEVVQSNHRPIDATEDRWEIDLAVPETAPIGGLFAFSVTLVDSGGLTATATKEFTLRDNQPPTVTILSAPELVFGRKGEITVKASDANSPIKSIVIQVNGAVTLDGSFKKSGDQSDETAILPLDIPLRGEGLILVTAVAIDKAGNRGEAKPVSIRLVGGAVQGTVFEGTKPVPGITVWTGTGATREAIVTNEKGRFLFTGLRPGKAKIVSSDSGRGLRAMREVNISDHGTLTLRDLFLQTGGSVTGQVRTAAGIPPERGVVVQANTGGSLPLQTLTDDSGEFQFDLLPLGQIQLSAWDSDGNRSEESVVRLVESDQKVTLEFIPRGTVLGQVFLGDNTPAAYVSVTLSRNRSAIADSEGRFLFDRLFPGTFSVTARDPATGVSKTVTDTLAAREGEKKSLVIVLAAMGTVNGTVYSYDKKPAIGMKVDLSSGGLNRSTQTDREGRFQFKQVPADEDSYSLFASDSGSGDYTKFEQVRLSKQGDAVEQELFLVGIGELEIQVKGETGDPVAGANVNLSGWRRSASGATDLDGVARFRSVVAGNYSVDAYIPGLRKYTPSVSFVVQAGKRTNIVLTFKETATITGRVLASDGVTPLSGVTVELAEQWYFYRSTLTDAQGRFSFNSLEIKRYYQLQALIKREVRIIVNPISLDLGGEVKEVDLVLMPAGTVTGHVFGPSGAPMGNVAVSLSFTHPFDGSQLAYNNTVTKEDGSYQLDRISVGPVRIEAFSLYDSTQKTLMNVVLSHEGETLVVNLHLGNDRVTLPTTLWTKTDTYSLSQDGSYSTSTQLTVAVNGQSASFPNILFGTYEQDRREIGITGEGPGGIVITRKLFVPERGYAVRALELFTNPTDQPMDMKIEIGSSHFVHRGESKSSIPVSGSVILPGAGRRIGMVFGGSARTGQLVQYHSEKGGLKQITYGMENVQVRPGETVGFLHFHSPSWNEKMIEAVISRLRRLPPEMMEGLSEGELASIINFDLTKDRDSQLIAPRMLSSLSAQVFQKVDGELIPIPNAQVVFQSTNPIFPLSDTAMTGPNGVALANASFLPTGSVQFQAFAHLGDYRSIVHSTVAAFREPFIVVDQEGVLSATLIFTETGVAEISFERPAGISSYAHLTLTHKETGKEYPFRNIAPPTSTITVLALPSGRYQATLTVDHSQLYDKLVVTSEFELSPSKKSRILIPPVKTGHLEGTVTTVSGQPANRVRISLFRPCYPNTNYPCGLSGFVYTDGAGRYQFIHLPPGLAWLQTWDPETNAFTYTEVLAQEGKTIQNLVFGATGNMKIQVLLANGTPAAYARVKLVDHDHRSPYYGSVDWIKTVYTNAQGEVTVLSLPLRAYTLHAFRPKDKEEFTHVFSERLVRLKRHGETADVVLQLPIAADIEVKAVRCGEPAARMTVSLSKLTSSDKMGLEKSTDDKGGVLFPDVTGGEYRLSVVGGWGWYRWTIYSTVITMTAHDENIQVNVAWCQTTIAGQVFAADGKTPIPWADVYITAPSGLTLVVTETDWEGRFEGTLEYAEFKGPIQVEAVVRIPTISGFKDREHAVQTVVVHGGSHHNHIDLSPLVIPLSAVKGRVYRNYRGHLQAALNPTLFSISPGVYNDSGRERNDFSHFDREGTYLFVGLPVGDFEITAHWPEIGQTEVRKGRIEAIDQAVELDIRFPPVNDVRVLVKDADENPLEAGRVGIDQVGASFTFFRNFEGGLGELIFREIPAAVPLVLAAQKSEKPFTISRPEIITLPDSDQLVTVNLLLPQTTASVQGTAVASDGFTPLTADASVWWEWALPTPFGFGSEGEKIHLNANGTFQLNSLPAAPIRLVVQDGASKRMGFQVIELKEKETQSVTLIADKETNTSTPAHHRISDCLYRPSVFFQFFPCLSIERQSTLLMGGRFVFGSEGEAHTSLMGNGWSEGETAVMPPVSIGSLLVSRRFITVPGSDQGVLSIDQIRNPYSVPITTMVEWRKSLSEIPVYRHTTGGLILPLPPHQYVSRMDMRLVGVPGRFIPRGARASDFFYVFGSSVENQNHRVVVPAASCRSVIHLWDLLLRDNDLMQPTVRGENFAKGIDLLNHFATLNLKAIVPEESLCPLAE